MGLTAGGGDTDDCCGSGLVMDGGGMDVGLGEVGTFGAARSVIDG